MSPEQAQDASKVTAATDIYALGAVLYECVTGRPPFRAATSLATLRQVTETEPASPRVVNPGVDRDLETICLRCLDKDALRRYRTADEVADELGRYRRGEPIVARPVNVATRAWRWSKRHPWFAMASGTIALLTLAVCLISITSAVLVTKSKRQADLALRDSLWQQSRALSLSNETGWSERAQRALQQALQIKAHPEMRDVAIQAQVSWDFVLSSKLQFEQRPSVILADPISTGLILCRDSNVKICRLDSAQVLYSWKVPTTRITCAAVHPNGAMLAVGDQHGFIHYWNRRGTDRPTSFQAHSAPARAITFGPGEHLASSDGSEVVVYDLRASEVRVKQLLAANSPLLTTRQESMPLVPVDVDIAANVDAINGESLLAAASTNFGFHLWVLKENELQEVSLGVDSLPTGSNVKVALTPDGRHILLACNEPKWPNGFAGSFPPSLREQMHGASEEPPEEEEEEEIEEEAPEPPAAPSDGLDAALKRHTTTLAIDSRSARTGLAFFAKLATTSKNAYRSTDSIMDSDELHGVSPFTTRYCESVDEERWPNPIPDGFPHDPEVMVDRPVSPVLAGPDRKSHLYVYDVREAKTAFYTKSGIQRIGAVRELQVAVDGLILVAGSSGRIALYNVAGPALENVGTWSLPLRAIEDAVVVASAAGTKIAVFPATGDAEVFQLKGPEVSSVLRSEVADDFHVPSWSKSVASHHFGGVVATAIWGRFVEVRDWNSGHMVATLEEPYVREIVWEHGLAPRLTVVTPAHSTRQALGEFTKLKSYGMYDTDEQVLPLEFLWEIELDFPVLDVAASPDSKWLAVCGRNSGVRILQTSLDGPGEAAVLGPANKTFVGVSFDSSGRWLVGADLDGGIWIWSEGNWKEIGTITSFSQTIGAIQFSPDSNNILVALADGEVACVDRATGRIISRGTPGSVVLAICADINLQHISTAHEDGSIQLWSREFQRLAKWSAHGSAGNMLFQRSDGVLLSSSITGEIKSWNLREIRKGLRNFALDW